MIEEIVKGPAAFEEEKKAPQTDVEPELVMIRTDISRNLQKIPESEYEDAGHVEQLKLETLSTIA